MKKILLIVLGILAFVFIVALLSPKDCAVERSIVINKPKADVFYYLVPLKNQDNWSTWAKKDPSMKKEFKGTDGTVGAMSMWDGNKDVGKGEQEITGIKDGERIDYELRFERPYKSKSPTYLITEAVNDSTTKVKWGFSASMPVPMNIMLLFMNMDKAVGKDFEQGLVNLKGILKKK
jgi:hypothetical protein